MANVSKWYAKRTKMIMEIDYLYGRVNELFELYDEEDLNEIKAHKLFRECCENFLKGEIKCR
tara:strand:- start:872 stop:1057 length:186 start_codon:yes stop_codon:yes gene_type:complete